VLRHHFRPGAIVATIDAVNGRQQLETYDEALKQVAVADRLVVTKTDLVSAEAIAALKGELARLNPAPSLQVARFGGLDIRRLLSADVYNPATRGSEAGRWRQIVADLEAAHDADGHEHGRHGGIAAFSLFYEQPLDWTAFGLWLTLLIHRHGQSVLRV